MKLFRTLSPILILLVFFLYAFRMPALTEITLNDAIKDNLISFSVVGNGGYAEGSLHYEITNNSKRALKIKIPAGTLFHPEEEDEQSLIQMEEQIVFLDKQGSKSIDMDGFCTESGDRCPKTGRKFTLAKSTHPKLPELVALVKGKSFDPGYLQDAVWAITDNEPISNLDYQTEEDRELRAQVAQLSGQENTWYRSPQHRTIDENGYINSETVSISGTLSFHCEKDDEIHDQIVDSEGNVLYNSDSLFKSRGGTVTYEFGVKVKGWTKGTYFVKVVDQNDNELTSYEFEV